MAGSASLSKGAIVIRCGLMTLSKSSKFAWKREIIRHRFSVSCPVIYVAESSRSVSVPEIARG